MDGYRVFLSHKFHDRDRDRIAAIAGAIDGLSPYVNVFNPQTGIYHGMDWRDQIYRQLSESDMLLLVYNDPNQDWSWCTYEAGLFSRLDADDEDPIVCLHHPAAKPPSQLEHLQCVPAEPEPVARFLTNLFRTTAITHSRWPLAADLVDAQVATAADIICAQFERVDTYYAVYRVELEIPLEADRGGIPEEAAIAGATPGIFELFGTPFGRIEDYTWGMLTASSRVPDRAPWLDELDEAVRRAGQRKTPRPSSSTVSSQYGGRFVRPIVYSVDRYDDHPTRVVLVFVEEPAPAVVGGRVFRMLRAMERAKSEMLDAYIDAREPGDLRLATTDLEQITRSLDLIEHETRAQGVFASGQVEAAFPADLGRQVDALGIEWGQVTARMRSEIDAGETGAVFESLLELAKIDHSVALVTAERYLELVRMRQVPRRTIDLTDAVDPKDAPITS